MSQALELVRQAAKARKKERFTALLHHVDLDLLRLSFYALKRNAAPGDRTCDTCRVKAGMPYCSKHRQQLMNDINGCPVMTSYIFPISLKVT